MTEKINSYCSICGKGYYQCISCKDMIQMKPWQLHTDTSEHYKIYQIIHGFSTGVYNKEEAKIKLQKVDLSDLDSLRDNIKNIINDIINEDKGLVDESTSEEFNATVSTDVGVVNDVASVSSKAYCKKRSSKVVETDDCTVPAE